MAAPVANRDTTSVNWRLRRVFEEAGGSALRTLGWVSLFLLLGLGSLKFAPAPPTAAATAARDTAAACARDFSAGFRDSSPPDLARYIPQRKLDAASAALCAGWVQYERKHPTATPDVHGLVAVVHEKPAAYTPLCGVNVQIDLAANASLYRFVTKAERKRYRREHCRLAVKYFRPNSMAIDLTRLAADHPNVYAPFCASMIQRGVGTAALASVSRRELQMITRRSCVEALESGAIRCGPDGFSDATVDDDGFGAILRRQGLKGAT